MNPMLGISIDKVTLNMGAGGPGEKLEKSKKLLEKVSGEKSVITTAHKRSTFGVAKGRQIGVKVIARGSKAEELLKRVLEASGNKVKASQFDARGNFSIGVQEYIDVPGMKYDPSIGIMGFDVAVTLKRAGYRVSKRRVRPARIGKNHVITREQAVEWVKEKMGAEVV
ncbi:MAG: 50S ribosomal protein L5 [Candidatus Aenigmarchaeota archaeon]|nr:50S ribosomal protein L5 [Candidatus Aenigmarchaeota archaeon]